METKRLKRIKPQFVPPRRLPWRRTLSLTPLPQNSDEAVTTLLAQFAHAARFRCPVFPRRAVGPASLILSVTLTGTILSVVRVPTAWSIILWCAVQTLLMLSLTCWTASDRLLSLSHQLSGCDDFRAIPALARALSWPEAGARAAAAQALTRLLPRLWSIHADLLDTATRVRLHRHLVRPKTPCRMELALAILKTLECVGDARDLRAVTALAHRHARNVMERRIQHAALVCLPYLTVRSEQQRTGLSPSALTDTPVATQVPTCPALAKTGESQENTLSLESAKNS